MVDIVTVAMLVTAYVVLSGLMAFAPGRATDAVPLLSYAAVAWLMGVGFWVSVAGLIIGSVLALPVRSALQNV